MKKDNMPVFVRTAIAASLLLAFLPGQASAADEMTQLTKPNSEITIQGGYLSGSNTRFGQYNGLRDEGAKGQLDFRINERDDATGSWLTVSGRNLGRQDAELRVDQSLQGNWGYFFEINKTPHYETLSIFSRNTGIGTNAVRIPTTGALQPVNLSTEREKLAFGFSKQLGESFDLKVSLQSEDKTGVRDFGQTSHQFVPEPISSVTNQWEAKLGYTDQNLQLSAGYLGSRYSNDFNQLRVLNAAGASSGSEPIALAPDNQSHQLFASGGYNFSAATRGTFKVSYTHAKQDESFMFVAPASRLAASASRGSLDGEINTSLVNLALTSRLSDRVSLLASVRYEDRDDNTPRTQFLSATTTRDGFNVITSRNSLLAKTEVAIRLPANYRLTAGVDYEARERDFPPLRQASWREKSDEVTGRIEARKALSETVNGAISYHHSERDGSNYLEAGDITDADVIAPVHWTDRSRDKVKLTADWTPFEKFSLQFTGEHSIDDYKQRELGPNKGKASVYSLDATYALSDDWQFSGWFTHDESTTDGGSCAVANARPLVSAGNAPADAVFCGQVDPTKNTAWRKWFSRLELKGDAVGFGGKGKITSKLSVGLNAEASVSKSSYGIRNGDSLDNVAGGVPAVPAVPGPAASTTIAAVPTAGVDLPSTKIKQSTVSLFADYAYRPDLSVRFTTAVNRSTTDDWQWTDGNGNAYGYINTTTNTLVSQPYAETVYFSGVSLTYKWW